MLQSIKDAIPKGPYRLVSGWAEITTSPPGIVDGSKRIARLGENSPSNRAILELLLESLVVLQDYGLTPKELLELSAERALDRVSNAEGWGLFCIDSRTDLIEIQRLDEGPIVNGEPTGKPNFVSDEAARLFVVRRAFDDESEPHQRATAVHNEAAKRVQAYRASMRKPTDPPEEPAITTNAVMIDSLQVNESLSGPAFTIVRLPNEPEGNRVFRKYCDAGCCDMHYTRDALINWLDTSPTLLIESWTRKKH